MTENKEKEEKVCFWCKGKGMVLVDKDRREYVRCPICHGVGK